MEGLFFCHSPDTYYYCLACASFVLAGMWWKGVAGIDGEDGSVNRHRSSVPAGLVLYSKNHRAHQHQGIKVSAVQQMERRKVLQSGLALVEGLAMVLRTTRKKKLVSG
ncbi:uncharacterized protein LOC110436250 [Sorghum bicolor]|uniref:Uncharacterized protein n=1 Tax=Sorghum bicolor TaxID=4558 RepID=A0A1Z5RCD4_SORBI|nr:uncharacterized protein LOC110436250 [Sorghum bicolor]OQU81423.1 hypothetical protein SORBI_3006G055501 [Sorghum bicolor]|eukprot:XP_021318449.1 uncharacterized protein LOC110436250 [Sorghum bicolor]